MEYTVIKESTALKLVAAVEHMIADGWEPQGGVACEELADTWAQAMIRRPAAFSTKKVSPKELSISSASAGVAQIDINAGAAPVH